ncbi:MAG: hypothetical protein K2R93_14630 [Gemmatimonadaceae bacterium]|nr:hypothetical protein [Gemmatimonadaceae bacterium]
MTTPDARLATPLEAAWQPAMGGRLAVPTASAAPRTTGDAGEMTATPRTWWRTGLRVVRDLAIGFAVIAAIPLATIAFVGPAEWTTNSTRDRVAEVERLRPLTLSSRAGITPIEAGEALYRLAPPRVDQAIAMRPVVPDVLPWDGVPADAALFADHRSNRWPGPLATKVIERAAQGYSAAEIAWLRQIAEAPLWRDADLVARAAQIDIDGARLAKPLDPETPWLYPPTTATQRLRKIGDAGVARAAYYVTQHDYAKAEEALRTVVSLGFALVDNGTSFLDALTGRVLIDIGRDGLHQLSALTGQRDLFARSEPFRSNPNAQRIPIAVREADAARNLADASLSRAFRFEQYGLMSYTSCSSVGKVLTGLSDAERAAMDDARRTLPRFASERNMLDLQGRRVDVIAKVVAPTHTLTSIIVGAGEVTAAVTGNPRIATCTRFAAARLDGH